MKQNLRKWSPFLAVRQYLSSPSTTTWTHGYSQRPMITDEKLVAEQNRYQIRVTRPQKSEDGPHSRHPKYKHSKQEHLYIYGHNLPDPPIASEKIKHGRNRVLWVLQRQTAIIINRHSHIHTPSNHKDSEQEHLYFHRDDELHISAQKNSRTDRKRSRVSWTHSASMNRHYPTLHQNLRIPSDSDAYPPPLSHQYLTKITTPERLYFHNHHHLHRSTLRRFHKNNIILLRVIQP